LQTMKIKNWKKSVLNRDFWKTIVERVRTHIVL
jgi:predicted N-acyltransferase